MTRIWRTACYVGLLLWLGAAQAEDKGPAASAAAIPTPPAVASKRIRAFTGNWMVIKPMFGLTRPGVVPFRPEYEAKLEALAKLAVAGEELTGNEPQCIPNGPPLDMAFGMQIFADAQQMLVLTRNPRVRYIWLDGRQHTPDELLFESYYGESIGHFEGDTLVVDTIGLKASDEIVISVPVNATDMHIVERWRITSPGVLRIDTTISSPTALTRPWSYARTYSRQPATDAMQYCTPATDRSREGGFDLTPPAGGYVPPGANK